MRRLVTIVALLAFTLYGNTSVVLWACYYASADAIAAAYCVNRANPCCHGKCHVARMTNDEQTGSTPISPVLTMKIAPFILAEQGTMHRPTRPCAWHREAPAPARDGVTRPIDHPPSLRC